MDFFIKNLKETLEAVNYFIGKNINTVNTKRVRQFYKIKPTNRSKINFIWRSLCFLGKCDILTPNGITTSKTYKIVIKDLIDIQKFVIQVEKDRTKRLSKI